MKRSFARQHLVEDRPKCKDICAVVSNVPTYLLRRHVSGCPHDHARVRCDALYRGGAGLRAELRLREFRQTEVQNLHVSVLGHEQVLRLQVTVDNSFFMRRRQSPRNLRPVIRDPADRHGIPHDLFPQGSSFQ